MTVSHIGARSISLYITEAELSLHNIDIHHFDCKDALALLHQALGAPHAEAWAAAELEIYPGKDSLLLFARQKTGKPSYFFFPHFEALLHCVARNERTLPSCLYQLEQAYILSVCAYEGECIPAVFHEFGTELKTNSYIEAHVQEQATQILSGNALCQLKTHFLQTDLRA